MGWLSGGTLLSPGSRKLTAFLSLGGYRNPDIKNVNYIPYMSLREKRAFLMEDFGIHTCGLFDRTAELRRVK